MNLATLKGLGFDRSEHIPWTKRYKVRCSQCAALVINGFPTHEQGCPNHPRMEQPEYPSDEWEPRQ